MMGLLTDEEFQRRLAIARGNVDSNCFGTALFLSGLIETEGLEIFDPYKKRCVETRSPTVGDLAIFQFGKEKFYHGTVIVSVQNGIRITHRPEQYMPINEYESLDAVVEEHALMELPNLKVRYFSVKR